MRVAGEADWRCQLTLPQNDRALLFGPSQRIAGVEKGLGVAGAPVYADDDAGIGPMRDDLRVNDVIIALDTPENTRTVVDSERHRC